MSAWTCRSRRQGRPKDRSTSSSNPMMEGPCADSDEKREPVSNIDTAAVDSLKVLDPKRPIREADIPTKHKPVCFCWGRTFLERSIFGRRIRPLTP
jgi:hypothetical protein